MPRTNHTFTSVIFIVLSPTVFIVVLHNSVFIESITGFHPFLYLLQDHPFATGFLQGAGEYFFLDLTRHDTYAVDVTDQDIPVIDPYALHFDRHTVVDHLSTRRLILCIGTVGETREIQCQKFPSYRGSSR